MTTPSRNPDCHFLPGDDLCFPVSESARCWGTGLCPFRWGKGALLKYAISCPRGAAAAGRTQARAPPPVWLEVELWNVERCLLPGWFLVCLVSRTLHCEADPLAAGGAVVSSFTPKGMRMSWGTFPNDILPKSRRGKLAEQFRNWSSGFPGSFILYLWNLILLIAPSVFFLTALLRYSLHTIQFSHLKCTVKWLQYIYRVVHPSSWPILECFCHPQKKPIIL